jgi:hypothetical protein
MKVNIEDREPTGETPLISAALAGQTQIAVCHALLPKTGLRRSTR